MPMIKAGEMNLEYYVEGEGPPLLMIMGFAGQAKSWGRPIMDHLKEHFTCITFSNRGAGASDKPESETTIRIMAGDTIALLDALGYERVHVFGISMGGMIAQEMAINHPERVNGLVLGCTTPGWAHGTPPNPEDTQGMAPAPGISREEQVRRFWPVICAPEFIERTGVDFLDEMMKISLAQPTPMQTLAKQAMAVQSYDSFDRLGEIEAPTLIIHGDIDLLVPYANAPVLHERIDGSQLKTLEGAAHMFFWEQPEAAASAVVEFLSRVPTKA